MLVQTKSSYETIQIGETIGRLLRPGDVVALVGELGTGKTHLIKGLAAGVGIRRSLHVSSPSFTFVHEYSGQLPLHHLDLFRLKTEDEVENLGLSEYFQKPGVTVIEWADKVPSFIPEEALWVYLQYRGEKTRSIEIIGKGKRYEGLVDNLKKLLKNYVPKKSKTRQVQ